MDIWLNINLTLSLIWFVSEFFTTNRKGINSLVDVVCVGCGSLAIFSWPIYLLALIWQ